MLLFKKPIHRLSLSLCLRLCLSLGSGSHVT